MIEREEEGLRWLEFELLAECKQILHRVFTRQGGVSLSPYEGLNYSEKVGDSSAHVSINRARVCASMPQISRFLLPPICHGDTVSPLLTLDEMPTELSDGVATQLPQVGLTITHADCQAALFYDPCCKAIAAVHCGWKGNTLNIYGKTISLMKAQFGSKPENILACISPSLGPKNAEFVNFRLEFPSSQWHFQCAPCYFDLWALSEEQLVKAGLLPSHIEIARVDTYENKKDFFSHRRERPTGRNVSLIAII